MATYQSILGFVTADQDEPTDGTLITQVDGNGNVVSTGMGTANLQLYPAEGYVQGPHFYANSLVTFRTTRDATAQEVGLEVQAIAETGYSTQAGNINNGKTAFNAGMLVKPNAGNAWVAALDMVIDPGVQPQFYCTLEVDMNNNAYDAAPGVANVAGIFMNSISAYSGTAGIWLSNGNPNVYSWHYGLFFQSASLVKDATIRDETSSPISLEIAGTHFAAAIDTSQMSGGTLINAAAGQAIKLGSGWMIYVDPTSGNLRFQNGSVELMSIDQTGKVISKGGFTKGTPV